MTCKMKIFAGSANPLLAVSIAQHLQVPMGNASVDTFSDGEIKVDVEENVRGYDIFIVQSTSAPTNDHLMEIMLLADALRRSSARSITAVIPYFGYARQDRRVRSARVPISAKVVADMLASVGITRVVTLDLHADQIQGFFYMPVDNIYSTSLLITDIIKQNYANVTVVSPDVGGVVRARAFAKKLNDTDLAIIDKRRPQPNELQVMNIIGDVQGRTCVLVDDMVDTAGTLCQAAIALKNNGAERVVAYCTHPILSGPAVERINASQLDSVVVTNTIKLSPEAENCGMIRQLDLAAFLSEAMRRVSEEESLSSMFSD